MASERAFNLRAERTLMKRWLKGYGAQDGRATHYTDNDNELDNTNETGSTIDTRSDTADQDRVC